MPGYGTIDFEYATRLAQCPPDDDGPVLMVNYMNYRERAEYGDGSDGGLTGMEADDAYAPTDVLADIGAVVAYFGDVIDDSASTGWHRIGIVQYPSRRAFIEMQARPDFREKHEHKEAGMHHTIVFAVPPNTIATAAAAAAESNNTSPSIAERSSRVVFDLVRHHTGTSSTPRAGQAIGPIEGVILGDGRVWSEVRITWLGEGDELPTLDDVAERERVVVRTKIDRLPGLIRTARESEG